MTNPSMKSPAILTLATLVALAACAGDGIVQPIAASSCVRGELAPGTTVTGAFTARSCAIPYHFRSGGPSPTVTYRVSLEAGRGYWFYMQQEPDADGVNDVDALLTLWGRDADGASTPLAVADDNAGGRDGLDAEFYFISPYSGTFNLAASTYTSGENGGFRVTMAECPVVATIDTAGTYTEIPFAESDCVRHDVAGSGDPTRIVLVGVPTVPYEMIVMDVTSGDFVPAVEIGGPGTDVFGAVFSNTRFDSAIGNPSSVQLITRDVGGMLTLAVGSDQLDPTGRFSLEVERSAQADLQADLMEPVETGQLTLRSAAPRGPKR